MKPEDIIDEVKEVAGEWLEMTDNPDKLISQILANRIVVLLDYVEFLNKLVTHDSHPK